MVKGRGRLLKPVFSGIKQPCEFLKCWTCINLIDGEATFDHFVNTIPYGDTAHRLHGFMDLFAFRLELSWSGHTLSDPTLTQC
mmetsp:Transcript_22186/g.35565  ORF Transcript_22186/g.35565 Transcript_22186/m.35565 type:complete len:83 (-) Transcript_22186:588-836(-)